MENYIELENLIKELSHGREMATELQKQLNVPSLSTNCEYLLHKIIDSYDKALSMVKNNSRFGGEVILLAPPAKQDSPLSLANDDSDQDFKDHASRKRKVVVQWTQKVQMCPQTGDEVQSEDDQYYWRKYGQKDIVGAKYPRGYYRCTHRQTQGCLATKQVQRSDKDPAIFDITYRRKHTCSTHASPSNVNNPPITLPEKGPSFNIQTSLGVITQRLGPNNENPFSFPLSPPTINLEKNNIFPDCNNISGNYPTNILSSTATIQSSNYSTIPTNHNSGGFIQNFDTLQSELSPITAGITSTSTSPTLGTHFPFGLSEFGQDFSFYNKGYFP